MPNPLFMFVFFNVESRFSVNSHLRLSISFSSRSYPVLISYSSRAHPVLSCLMFPDLSSHASQSCHFESLSPQFLSDVSLNLANSKFQTSNCFSKFQIPNSEIPDSVCFLKCMSTAGVSSLRLFSGSSSVSRLRLVFAFPSSVSCSSQNRFFSARAEPNLKFPNRHQNFRTEKSPRANLKTHQSSKIEQAKQAKMTETKNQNAGQAKKPKKQQQKPQGGTGHELAISFDKEKEFAEWYPDVIKKAEMIEYFLFYFFLKEFAEWYPDVVKKAEMIEYFDFSTKALYCWDDFLESNIHVLLGFLEFSTCV